MKKFGLIFGMIARNWIPLLYFEIIYKTFGFAVFFPFVRYLLSLLPGLAGLNYLGQENVGELFKNPAAVLTAAVILILAALYVTCEITAFMLLCEKGWRGEPCTVLQLCKETAARTIYLLKPVNAGVLVMLLVLACSVFSPVSGYLKLVRVPEFILEHIWSDVKLTWLFIGILIVFHVLLLLYIFGLPAMIFSGKTFLGSWRESLALLRGRKLRTAGTVIVLTAMFLFVILGLAAVFIAGHGIYARMFYEGETGAQMLRFSLSRWLKIFSLAGSTLSAAFLCGIIVVLYHIYKEEQRPRTERKKSGSFRSVLRDGSAAALIIIMMFFIETEIGGEILLPVGSPPSVIAHRAGAAQAPENTLAALSGAIADGADMVEIDVQQLGDGTLIVLHDTNFKRTTGVDLDVWDAGYQMIRDLNAGAAFYQGTAVEPVPSLEEFLAEAKGKMNLMLELKKTGYEKDVEQKVLDLIGKYDMRQQCVIASMDLGILKKVRELDPDMETVYISALLITDRFDLDAVDGYSVETTSLSRGMAIQASFQGKKIYGWTVNSGHSIKKALNCEVDGLITDYPRFAKEYFGRFRENLLINEIVRVFYP